MHLADDMIYDNELLEINEKTLFKHAFTNIDLLSGKPNAIVLEFHGLGATKAATLREAGKYEDFEREFAKKNVLTVFPYYGFWAWMNDRSAKYVDMIIEAVCKITGVDPHAVPIISTGTSMGGLSAILYSKKAAITPKACFASCPVIDLVAFAAHPYVPHYIRTVYSTLAADDMGNALREHSPYHVVPYLPRIPYYIVYGGKDTAVLPELHSKKFKVRMEEYGHDITVIEAPECGHIYPYYYPKDIQDAYFCGILKFCLRRHDV